MNIGAILVGVALVIAIAAFVARPLVEKPARAVHGAVHDHPREQLIVRRDAIYALIRELDADYQTGKINHEDYHTLREQYVAEGVSILKQLDAVASQGERTALDAEIEAKVLALRQARSTQPTSHVLSSHFCTQCGQPLDPGDQFCAYCGHPAKGATSR